jgi:general secretion pathway protein I
MTSSCDRGFTLLEVLVALAIAGLALSVMTDAASGGLFAVRTAAGYEEAVSRAKSHLAALGNDGSLAPGQTSGEDGGGYRWRIAVAEAGHPAGQPTNGSPAFGLALYDVEVAISWTSGGRRREVVLHTQRLGRWKAPSDG